MGVDDTLLWSWYSILLSRINGVLWKYDEGWLGFSRWRLLNYIPLKCIIRDLCGTHYLLLISFVVSCVIVSIIEIRCCFFVFYFNVLFKKNNNPNICIHYNDIIGIDTNDRIFIVFTFATSPNVRQNWTVYSRFPQNPWHFNAKQSKNARLIMMKFIGAKFSQYVKIRHTPTIRDGANTNIDLEKTTHIS